MSGPLDVIFAQVMAHAVVSVKEKFFPPKKISEELKTKKYKMEEVFEILTVISIALIAFWLTLIHAKLGDIENKIDLLRNQTNV